MISFTVTKKFTIQPMSIVCDIDDVLQKYQNSVMIKVNGNSLTNNSFWNWIGSESSLEFIEVTSTQDDPSTGVLSEIDPDSNFTTLEIVNKINDIVNYLQV